MADASDFIHMARPLGPASVVGALSSTAPLNVTILPQALLSILDHSNRRNPDQGRVIGTLLGTRSDDGSEVEIRSCYAVPHTESKEQVEVDVDYQKHMLALHARANPRETLVGWYATGSELNMFSALIQNFYGRQGDGTWPHPAVHLTVSAEPGHDVETRTYVSSSIGVTPEHLEENCVFVPVPHRLKVTENDRPGLEIAAAASRAPDQPAQPVLSDLDSLDRSLVNVLGLIDRVSTYVSNVLDEETTSSKPLGQFLMNELSLAPKVTSADIEKNFNNHVQDVLLVSYLSNTIRTQLDLSNRLATAALTLAGPDVLTPTEGGGRGASGGNTGGGGGGGGEQRRGKRSQNRQTEQ